MSESKEIRGHRTIASENRGSTLIFGSIYAAIAIVATAFVVFAGSVAVGAQEDRQIGSETTQELSRDWVWKRRPTGFDYMWRVPR
jgi:hypothetical protein